MASANKDEIVHHRGTSDPTDYQVDDTLLCVAAGYGLQAGEHYAAHTVTRRKVRGRVVTTVTVSAGFQLVDVVDAESFLLRTRVVAEVLSPNGTVRVHSFLDAEEFAVWCAFTRTPPEWIRSKRYAEAEPTPPASCRFTAMCVPGELDEGSEEQWYVYDLGCRTCDWIGAGPGARSLAAATARQANRVSNDEQLASSGEPHDA